MRAAISCLLLTACNPCGGTPLGALAGEPRVAIVVTNTNGEPATEPDILEDYAAIVLYDVDATPLHEHWLDSYTNAASTRFTARSVLPSEQAPGVMAFAREDHLVAFTLATGEVAVDASIAGEITDFVETDSTVFAARADGSIAVLEDGAVAHEIPDSAGPLVPIDAERAAAVRGSALWVVDASGGVTSIDLGRPSCSEAVRLGGRIAVLCGGDVVLVAIADLTIVGARDGTGLSAGLVALAGDWVAGVVRERDREDALVAVHLASDTRVVLHDETWMTLWGAPLGEGAFTDGVLLWPSVTRGVLRWRMNGEDTAASFEEASTIVPPPCYQLPARRVLSVTP